MTRTRRTILAAVATLAALAPGHAYAAPVGVWVQAPATLTVGVPATFTATATGCVNGLSGRVDWSWRYVTSGYRVLNGGQLGSTPTITWTPDAYAQSKPYIIIVGVVGCLGTTNNFATVQRAYVVQAAPAVAPAPAS